jgi:uncharacterized membrane protein YeaQ/YmgE (transglycosylase-associated protein family)
VERPILSWIAIGLIIGLIAARILPGREPGGRILTVLISIAGALVAGVVHLEIGRYRAADGPGWIAAALGAVVLLTVYRLFIRGREDS